MKIIFNNIFCFHKQWSKVDSLGYQYCGLCGIAVQAPPPPAPAECTHPKKEVLEVIKTHSKITGSEKKITYVQRCIDCGGLSNHDVFLTQGINNLFTTTTTE